MGKDDYSQMIDNLLLLDKKELALFINSMLNKGVDGIAENNRKKDPFFYFSAVAGYLDAHINNDDPTTVMITGNIISSIERYLDICKKYIEEARDKEKNE